MDNIIENTLFLSKKFKLGNKQISTVAMLSRRLYLNQKIVDSIYSTWLPENLSWAVYGKLKGIFKSEIEVFWAKVATSYGWYPQSITH